jgi:thiosulfate reductase cytochrome b subunit
VHNKVGLLLIANFFVWLLFYLFSDRIRAYHAELDPRKHFRESFRQMRYYAYGMFRGEPNPHHASIYDKFNPLQATTYQMVMFILVPVQFVTGLLLWDVTRFSAAVEWLGGLRVVDTIHVLLFIFFVAYIIVHAYLGALGRTPIEHFKAMVTGYEEVEAREKTTGAH